MDRNGNLFFFWYHSETVPSRFCLKRRHNDDFQFFALFLQIPIPGLVGMDRNDNFFFRITLSLSHPAFASNEALMMFFSFLNFFVIFLEFPILGWVGMDQNDNFFFLYHSQPVTSRFGFK